MDLLRPSTWADALEFGARHPDASPITGGTDVMTEINTGHRRPSTLLDLTRVDERNRATLGGTMVTTSPVCNGYPPLVSSGAEMDLDRLEAS
ncbi:FAD binding domain-containing protein [Streptomyces sp. ISL-94]|nr:FAD binding domain-containing protein [Streptomyces sp. ISL-94]